MVQHKFLTDSDFSGNIWPKCGRMNSYVRKNPFFMLGGKVRIMILGGPVA